MDMKRLTEKAQEAIATAQRDAEQRHNTQLEPEHLLAALVTQTSGVVPAVLEKLGVQPSLVAQRIDTIPVPDVEVEDPDENSRVLVLGWGSTYGPIGAACRALRQRGLPIAQAHLRHLNPLPANLGEVLAAYDKVVIPEMNLGQLAHVIRAKYLVDAVPFNQVSGLPFTAAKLENMLEDVVKNG